MNWRRLKCVTKPPSPTRAASKAAASKVSPAPQARTHEATKASPAHVQHPSGEQQPLSQQQPPPQQQQQPQQPQPQQQQQQPRPQAPAWMMPLQRGMGLQQAGRWEEAAASYQSALDIVTAPGGEGGFRSDAERAHILSSVRTNLGLALQNSERAAEAAAQFAAVVAAQPANADAHHNHANALYADGLHAEAAAGYGRAVALNGRDAESYFRLGNSHDKLGAVAEAAAAFAMAVHLEPADASAGYNLANSYRTLGRTDEALEWYRRALAATPKDASKHANLAHTLDGAGRFDEAAASFLAALTLEPNDAGTYTSLGHAYKSAGRADDAIASYRSALQIEPRAAAAYAGLGNVLKDRDPKGAAAAFAAAAEEDAETGDSEEAVGARGFRAWLSASPPPPPLPSARPGAPRDWAAVKRAAVYPDVFEQRAKGCEVMSMGEAEAMGSEKLLAKGPTLLRNASGGWRLRGWTDEALAAEVGRSALRMLVMPTDTHPTLDPPHEALVEPAASGIFFGDYLRLLDRLAETEEFAVYVAQLNLLKLPPLLKQVCLPKALPADRMTMANFWVGGHSMKNGLHFDNFDNLLFQIAGSKRALLFPPDDQRHLYYSSGSGANIRRHTFALEGGGFANETVHETVRKNVAMINVFDDAVGETHPNVRQSSPLVCELSEGDALFLPKGWHHAVISSAEGRRNLAVNTWYDLRGQTTPLSRVSSLDEMFQPDGCEVGSS